MLRKWMLIPVLVVGMAGAAFLSQQAEPAGLRMTSAGQRFVASLKPEQKAKALFAFDDKDRTNWNFVPLQDKAGQPLRKGLPLEEMSDEQKDLARQLVAAGTSTTGYEKATTIMSLENLLKDLEKGKGPTRNPQWYFVSVFGTPAKDAKWGCRVEGHHLSLNFTIDHGQMVSATPFFFGSNPATVKGGPRDGLRTLPEAEDTARDLFAALDADQKKVALQPNQFPEIEQGKSAPNLGAPVGLPASRMTEKQKGLLQQLIDAYAGRMPPDIAANELSAIKEAGLDKVTFAFARDEDKPGKPYTYRVQGPTFVIEFVNVQEDSAKNPANHIHSSYRKIQGDFGIAVR
jgi:hypothetical protein